jgi:hypothetical protein
MFLHVGFCQSAIFEQPLPHGFNARTIFRRNRCQMRSVFRLMSAPALVAVAILGFCAHGVYGNQFMDTFQVP